MCREAQFDLVIPNVDVRMMIHRFSKLCHSIQKAYALHEVLENEKFRDSLSSQTPPINGRDLGSDLFVR